MDFDNEDFDYEIVESIDLYDCRIKVIAWGDGDIDIAVYVISDYEKLIYQSNIDFTSRNEAIDHGVLWVHLYRLVTSIGSLFLPRT
ncbi:MAG: hypothetical protein RPV21_01400 [Candidatus Sedimenticola sp. (ex Thyasira tokunagai)]